MGTDATPTRATVPPSPSAADPYFYGWRMVPRWDDRGSHHWEKVPLTEWDVLHPEEDDFIVQTDAHDHDCHYLKDSFEEVVHGRAGVEVFSDLRIDWQVPGLGVHGPDVVVFEGLTRPWDRERATFPVKGTGARPVLVVEVTSPNTRDLDTVTKVVEYHRAGVPLYVIVNRQEVRDRPFLTVIGYRSTDQGYVILPDDPKGVWVEPLRLWIRPLGDRVACIDERGNRIPERLELSHLRDTLKARVETAETARDTEKRRADAEKQRADAAEQKLKELEAELKRLRGDTN